MPETLMGLAPAATALDELRTPLRAALLADGLTFEAELLDGAEVVQVACRDLDGDAVAVDALCVRRRGEWGVTRTVMARGARQALRGTHSWAATHLSTGASLHQGLTFAQASRAVILLHASTVDLGLRFGAPVVDEGDRQELQRIRRAVDADGRLSDGS